jgi:hypothetical protein
MWRDFMAKSVSMEEGCGDGTNGSNGDISASEARRYHLLARCMREYVSGDARSTDNG